jgi:(2Fe-2S) ferredoxin
MKESKNPYKRHIFVCAHHRDNGEDCCSKPGEEICEYLKEAVKAHGLKGKVRVSRSGCFDFCSMGPNVMIFPDYIWFRKVGKEDLEEIVQKYIVPLKES